MRVNTFCSIFLTFLYFLLNFNITRDIIKKESEVDRIKNSNTRLRLLFLMEERQLQQKDILTLLEPFCTNYKVKFNKSDISQYVAGKSEPNQDKLYILSKALEVDVVWLMGYEIEENKAEILKSDEQKLIDMYRQLDTDDKVELRVEAKHMLKDGKYQKQGGDLYA